MNKQPIEAGPAPDPIYKKLRNRLNRYPVGAPASPIMYRILEHMFTRAEAEIGAMMPMRPITVEKLAGKLGTDPAGLEKTLDSMAEKGLVMDFFHPRTEKRYFMLSPTVIGFFEFSLMRERDDVDQRALAELYDQYMFRDQAFVRQAFSGSTQLGRAMVNEEALGPDSLTEVLDTDRASVQIAEADLVTVSLCYCRHKSKILEHPCELPVESCISLNRGAEYLSRNKLGRIIDRSEALELMARMREFGAIQTLDNVQQMPGFMCNCCGCCCGMLIAISRAGMPNAVITSNWIAAIDEQACNGCGLCADRCPIDAIAVEERVDADGRKRRKAAVNQKLCLGCGVCVQACKKSALGMKSRARRVVTPVDVMEKTLLQAIERGKLQELIFDDDSRLDHRFLRDLTGAVLSLPPVKAILVSDAVKSRFLDAAMKSMNKG